MLENVKLKIGDPLRAAAVKQVIAESEKRLLGKGRLLIRKSGTEPLIRILVEGKISENVANISKTLDKEIKKILNDK